MKALQFFEWQNKPELRDVPDPDPGPGEVLIKVAAAGACHSDLHVMNEFGPDAVPYELPFTLGHENAGYIEALGDGVAELRSGDRRPRGRVWAMGLRSLRELPYRS